jgi:hypothetical protein
MFLSVLDSVPDPPLVKPKGVAFHPAARVLVSFFKDQRQQPLIVAVSGFAIFAATLVAVGFVSPKYFGDAQWRIVLTASGSSPPNEAA